MVSAIVVAGGSGRRIGGELPKQFIRVRNTPILRRTIDALSKLCDEIIVVLPANEIDLWHEICEKDGFVLPHKIVRGGKERFHSVQNGIAALDPQSQITLVHDGVRPFVSTDLIVRVIEAARKYGAVVPVTAVTDTIRTTDGLTLLRSSLCAVQTPQGFDSDILRGAYDKCSFDAKLTDDASVVEQTGCAIHLVEGERENIKITTPLDLKIAEILW